MGEDMITVQHLQSKFPSFGTLQRSACVEFNGLALPWDLSRSWYLPAK